MSGLILKDIFTLKQQAKMYLILIAFFIFVGISSNEVEFLGGAMMIFTVMIPLSTTAYDEKANWDRYALTMPLSRSDIIISKYVLASMCAILGSVLSIIVGASFSIGVIDLLRASVMFISIGMTAVSIVLPFAFKLGEEKGRLSLIILVSGFILFKILTDKLNIVLISQEALIQIAKFLPIIAIVITTISIFVSIKIYKTKEF